MECKITSSLKIRSFLNSKRKIYFSKRIDLTKNRHSLLNGLSDLKKHQKHLYLKFFYTHKYLLKIDKYFGLPQKYNLITIKL